MKQMQTSIHYRRNIKIVVFVIFGIFITGYLFQRDKLQKATGASETWAIISGIASLCAIVLVLVIYWLDNMEKEKDRKEAMKKEHEDRQQALMLQEKERTLYKNLLVLVNFMLHYISIEDTLLKGVRISNINRATFPKGVGRIFPNTTVTTDNIFVHLDILYAILDYISKIIKACPTSGIKVKIDGVLGVTIVEIEDKYFFEQELLRIGMDYFVYDLDNKRGEPEPDREGYVVCYNNNDIPTYFVASNFAEQIEKRLMKSLAEIKQIDKECRLEVGYPLDTFLM